MWQNLMHIRDGQKIRLYLLWVKNKFLWVKHKICKTHLLILNYTCLPSHTEEKNPTGIEILAVANELINSCS